MVSGFSSWQDRFNEKCQQICQQNALKEKPDSGYIDVHSFPPGTEIKDPYTGKIFLTP
jgi:hypothetical protein